LAAAFALSSCGGSVADSVSAGPKGPDEPLGSVASGVFVVDRDLDANALVAAGKSTIDDLDETHFRRHAPEERYEVVLDGSRATIRSLMTHAPFAGRTFDGELHTTNPAIRRFQIEKGILAGGTFTLRGSDAELTFYGSGVPIVSSERGKIVSR
jgi:hypothetical protein